MRLFAVILQKMGYFLLLMMLGFCLGKLGLVPKKSLPTFSGLIVKVFLPALQMSLIFKNQTTFGTFPEKRVFVALQLMAYALLLAAALGGAALFRVHPPKRSSFRGGMVGGNVGFLLVPLVLSVFPEGSGESYIPVLVALDTTVVWSIGLLLYSEGSAAKNGIVGMLRGMFNPMLIAILLALTLMTLHVPIPSQVQDVVDALGSVAGTLGLMILGVNIFYMDKHVKGEVLPCLGFIALRQIVVPLLVYVVSRRFTGETEAMLLMLLCGVPTMTSTGLLAIEYHTDVDFASTLVFLSTMASLVTIPLISFLAPLLA